MIAVLPTPIRSLQGGGPGWWGLPQAKHSEGKP